MLWIDATANIDRFNTEPKIVALVERIAKAGFNTIVFDVKPISGQVLYPSRLAPKITEWRGRLLPADFDPVPPMIREAKRRGLSIFASLNAFSEGHNLMKAGLGFARPDQQSVLYETENRLAIGEQRFPLARQTNRVEAGALSVFTNADSLPPAEIGAFVVSLSRTEKVVDGFDRSVSDSPKPTVPRNGVLLYGVGPGADFLRSFATPGTGVGFVTEPVFARSGERTEQQIPLMMNPFHPDARSYALEIARELATKYPFDGIIYDDRLRFHGMNADFSPQARELFERRVGSAIQWPNDVFEFTITPRLERGLKPGPHYDAWMAFRAETMRDFLREVRRVISSARRGIQLAAYAGSWYGEYASIGSNWASERFDAGFWFLTPQYRASGFAAELDFLVTGAYYPTATIQQAMSEGRPIGFTVESAGYLTNRAVRDSTWSYTGIELFDFRDDPDALQDALQAALASSQGVMVFDLSHDIEPFWSVFERAFSQPKRPPHSFPGLLLDVRRRRMTADRMAGFREPPVVIAAGSAGTGQ
jgi:hypothetical protein